MASQKIEKIVHLLEKMLQNQVWQETFLLRWASNNISSKIDKIRSLEDQASPDVQDLDVRVPVFVEIYQKDLGIITLSRVLPSLGDRAYGKNVCLSYDQAKQMADNCQRLQKHIAFIEVSVLENKVMHSNDGRISLAEGSITMQNVKGAWFRDVYYTFDYSKRMFLR